MQISRLKTEDKVQFIETVSHKTGKELRFSSNFQNKIHCDKFYWLHDSVFILETEAPFLRKRRSRMIMENFPLQSQGTLWFLTASSALAALGRIKQHTGLQQSRHIKIFRDQITSSIIQKIDVSLLHNKWSLHSWKHMGWFACSRFSLTYCSVFSVKCPQLASSQRWRRASHYLKRLYI